MVQIKIAGENVWVPRVETPCSMNPDAWADPPTTKTKRRQVEFCQFLCETECPVKNECLETALKFETVETRSGIRGGLTPKQREELIKRNQTGRLAKCS